MHPRTTLLAQTCLHNKVFDKLKLMIFVYGVRVATRSRGGGILGVMVGTAIHVDEHVGSGSCCGIVINDVDVVGFWVRRQSWSLEHNA